MTESTRNNLLEALKFRLDQAKTQEDLNSIKSQYMGKNSTVKEEFSRLKNLSRDLRPAMAKSINATWKEICDLVRAKEDSLATANKPDYGNTRFSHFEALVKHSRTSEHVYVRVTAAFTPEDNGFKFGFSFCSPNDNFCKDRGKELAFKRLNQEPTTVVSNRDPMYLAHQLLKSGSDVVPHYPNNWRKVWVN